MKLHHAGCARRLLHLKYILLTGGVYLNSNWSKNFLQIRSLSPKLIIIMKVGALPLEIKYNTIVGYMVSTIIGHSTCS